MEAIKENRRKFQATWIVNYLKNDIKHGCWREDIVEAWIGEVWNAEMSTGSQKLKLLEPNL